MRAWLLAIQSKFDKEAWEILYLWYPGNDNPFLSFDIVWEKQWKTESSSQEILYNIVRHCPKYFLNLLMYMIVELYKTFDKDIKPSKTEALLSLHLHVFVEGLYFYFSLSVCLSVCVCVCEQNSSRTNAPIWMRFSLNSCLLHWLKPYWNWWPWVKGQGHCDRKCF